MRREEIRRERLKPLSRKKTIKEDKLEQLGWASRLWYRPRVCDVVRCSFVCVIASQRRRHCRNGEHVKGVEQYHRLEAGDGSNIRHQRYCTWSFTKLKAIQLFDLSRVCTTAFRWIVFVLVWQMSKLYVLKQSRTVVCDVCFQIQGISCLYVFSHKPCATQLFSLDFYLYGLNVV